MVLRKATGRAVIKQRIITAVIALPILVLCVFYASQGLFSGLLFVISALALREFYRMALPGERRLEGSLSIVAGIFCCLGIVYAASPSAILLSIVLPFLLLTLVYLFRCQDMQKVSRDLAVSLFGILYIPVLLAHAVLLRALPDGRNWLFVVLFVVMASDSLAYLFGMKYGKHSLYEAVSPKKTV